LLRNGIKTIIISKEKTPIVKKWSSAMNVAELRDGVLKKEEELDKICKQFKLKNDQIAYIGDDVNDIKLLEKVGFSCSPNDAIDQVLSIVDYVCKRDGGNGCFREFANMILISQYGEKINWY